MSHPEKNLWTRIRINHIQLTAVRIKLWWLKNEGAEREKGLCAFKQDGWMEKELQKEIKPVSPQWSCAAVKKCRPRSWNFFSCSQSCYWPTSFTPTCNGFLQFLHLKDATTLPGTGFSFYLFLTFWLQGKFNLAFCSLPSFLTDHNKQSWPGRPCKAMVRPQQWSQDNSSAAFLHAQQSQTEPTQKPRIAVPLLNIPDSPDAIAVLTHTNKLGPNKRNVDIFHLKEAQWKSGPVSLS